MISSIPYDDELVIALRRSARWIRDLLRFAFSDDIALPREPLRINPISPKAFAQGRLERIAQETSCTDLLAVESSKLMRLFVRGGHPTLTDKRRVELWLDIVERLPEGKREILESIRMYATLPGDLGQRITRDLVEQAFPEMLDAPVTAEPPPAPYACNSGLLSAIPGEDDPSAIVSDAPMPDDGRPEEIATVSNLEAWMRDEEEARRRYAEAYAKIQW